MEVRDAQGSVGDEEREGGLDIRDDNSDTGSASQGECSSCSNTETSASLRQKQKLIRAVYANKDLSDSERARCLSEINLGKRSRAAAQASWVSESESTARDEELERRPTFHDEAQTILGCSHYMRKCKLRAACCQKFVTCRLCHDAAEDHEIDRFATEEVLCMLCGEVQPVAEHCRRPSCGVKFAKHFCRHCKFYDNDPNKDIYHCDDCGICRVGKGVGIDNYHCLKCNACVAIESKGHKCIEGSLRVPCPICQESLFTSVRPAVFMRCGHTMHSHCYEQYTKTHYTCPICCRSLADMTSYYRMIDDHVRHDEIPDEYRNVRQRILCQDCHAKTEVEFHFHYHMCGACKSYNTRVLENLGPSEPPDPGTQAVAAGGGLVGDNLESG